MNVHTLALENFRNYEKARFAFDPSVNLVCGENGQGKTNLLEAVAACSTMRLFRTAQKKEGLRFEADHAFIRADFAAHDRDFTVELRLSRAKSMEIYKNGVRQKRQADMQGLLKTVLFCPEDLMLVRAGAGARRRFLDVALCQLRPNYARYLEEYNRLHDHKTRILRDSEEKPSLLNLWEDFSLRMAYFGARIIRYRAYYCRRLLEALLRDSGVPWEQSGAWTRFRFREGAMVWELACRCRQGEVLIYSRYPMTARERAAALEACGEANGALTRGAMFLQGETPAFRIRADLGDPYGARERLAEALEYSAAVMARYWGAFQNACRG